MSVDQHRLQTNSLKLLATFSRASELVLAACCARAGVGDAREH